MRSDTGFKQDESSANKKPTQFQVGEGKRDKHTKLKIKHAMCSLRASPFFSHLRLFYYLPLSNKKQRARTMAAFHQSNSRLNRRVFSKPNKAVKNQKENRLTIKRKLDSTKSSKINSHAVKTEKNGNASFLRNEPRRTLRCLRRKRPGITPRVKIQLSENDWKRVSGVFSGRRRWEGTAKRKQSNPLP